MRRAATVAVLTCLAAVASAGERPINVQDIELGVLVKQVQAVTKRSFLFKESDLKGKRVTLASSKSIDAGTFYKLFATVCQVNGLTLVPVMRGDAEFIKITPSVSAFKEAGEIPIVTRAEEVPAGEVPVTYIVNLRYTEPQQVMQVLQPLMPQGAMAVPQGTSMLVINAAAAAIRRANRIVSMLDVPGAGVEVVYKRVQEVPPLELEKKLQAFVDAYQKAGARRKSRLSIMADERQDMVILMGPESEVAQIQAALNVFDQKPPPGAKREIKYYKLKSVTAENVVSDLTALLGAQLGIAVTTGGAKSASPGAKKEKVEEAVLIPNKDRNTLIVAASERAHGEIDKYLRHLDVRKPQVLIEVAIVQVSHDDSIDFGIQFLGSETEGLNTLFGGGAYGFGELEDPGSVGFPTGQKLETFQGAALRLTRVGNFDLLLQALSTDTRVQIVSQPLLLVNDNETATFMTKVSEPTTTTVVGTSTTNISFQGFAEATTSLKITPHVGGEDYLILEVQQDFEEFQGQSPGAGIPPPKVSNSVQTNVTVPNDHTIVIGGFIRNMKSKTRTRIPILGDIPILGLLFRRTTNTNTKSTMYLFVHTRILRTADFDDLIEVSRSASSQMRLEKEDLLKGPLRRPARPSLPGSSSRGFVVPEDVKLETPGARPAESGAQP